MTLDELLSLLDTVHQRSNGRHAARCQAHADKSPSLSVSEGEKGILLKCWAGCSTEDICVALGIKVADLFFDAGVPHSQRPAPRPPRLDRRAVAFQFELGAVDLRLRAERIAQAAIHVDIGCLTDAELDRALALVAQGYADVERAQLFEHVADTLRTREFTERISCEQRQRVA